MENCPDSKTCFYCNKVFNNYQALGGHLRIHKQNRLLRTRNSPIRLSNSSETYRNHTISVPNSRQHCSSGLDGNHPTPFNKANSPFGLPRMFCANEMNKADINFTENTPDFAKPPSFLLQNFSYGLAADINYLSSSLSSTVSAPPGSLAALCPTAFAISGTGSSSDLSMNVGSNAICQFNTDNNFWICRDGLPSSQNAWVNYQGRNSGPNLCFSIDKGKYNQNQGSVSIGDKRSFLGEGITIGGTTNVSTKQKDISGLAMESEEPGKKNCVLPSL